MDARAFEELVNDPSVHVVAKSDFFAVSGDPKEGVVPVITRVVDYRYTEAKEPVYHAPIA